MCLILFSYRQHPSYPLLVAANRDEFYERPAAPIHMWTDAPDVIGGRDLRAGGTWLGITRTGRFAALTNVREPGMVQQDAPSRGDLVADFLTSKVTPGHYAADVARRGTSYNGFNLLIGDLSALWYVSNRGEGPRALEPGLYGLSNDVLDTPWPKVTQGKAHLRKLILSNDGERPEPTTEDIDPDRILDLLASTETAPDDVLPSTGVSLEWERILSAACIVSPAYGTRASTALVRHADERVTIVERTLAPGGIPDGKRRMEVSLVTQPTATAT